jgi:hypothetical protein
VTLTKQVDPKIYGLPPRTVLIQTDSEAFVLVIKRKSRIIMKDAKAILEKVGKIMATVPNASVTLETTAPVCSKSSKFLKENNVEILEISI